jgi:hypothetical protein
MQEKIEIKLYVDHLKTCKHDFAVFHLIFLFYVMR